VTPSETLAAGAQIAVALAGFTGIAASFDKGALHEWSPGDRLRYLFLLILSLLPLAWCLIGLLLLTIGLSEPEVWRISSALSAVLQAFWPFFATIVGAMLIGLLQFARLILQRPRGPKTPEHG
jgi:hypothetical protein